MLDIIKAWYCLISFAENEEELGIGFCTLLMIFATARTSPAAVMATGSSVGIQSILA